MPSHPITQIHAAAAQQRRIRAAAVVAGLFATPAAWAGFVLSQNYPIPPANLELPSYVYNLIAPFGMDLSPTLAGSGVASEVRYVERLQSRLPTLSGSVDEHSDQADSGWVTTQQSGKPVTAIASLAMEPFNGQFPAAARTSFMTSHVYASSEPKPSFTNSGPVSYGGADYAANTLYLRRFSEATAKSYWYDVWSVGNQPASIPVTLAVDGQLRPDSDLCGGQDCGFSFPPGTGTVTETPPSATFVAEVAVFDLNQEIPCHPLMLGPCGPGTTSLMPVAYMALAYVPEAGDSPTLSMDVAHTLNVETQPGHRYLSVSSVVAVSNNGSLLDFYNTASVQVLAPPGTVYSDGLGGADLGLYFAQAVPEPGTWALWAAGLLGLASVGAKRRR